MAETTLTTQAPRDLSLTWAHDAMVLDARPFSRDLTVPGLWVGPVVAVLFIIPLVITNVIAIVMALLWVSYVLYDWLKDLTQASQTQQLRLTATELSVVRKRGDKEIYSERVPLRAVGRVTAKQTMRGFRIFVRRAGGPDFEIPINNESLNSGTWLAATIEGAGKAARAQDGDGIGEIPVALRELISRSAG